jgi:hypothetical protein
VNAPDPTLLTERLGPPADCQAPIRAIFDYWQRISPPGQLPGRAQFDPADIPALLPSVWLLDVVPAPASSLRWHFRYRLVGTELVRMFKCDPTGQLLHEAWPSLAAPGSIYPHHVAVVEQRRPSFRRGRSLYDSQRDYQWLERILLPLARDGATVDMILGLTMFFQDPAPGT